MIVEDTLSVRAARLGDAAELAPELRDEDLREIRASVEEEPCQVLERGILESDPCYAVVDRGGKVVALFGVVPDQPDDDDVQTGKIWLLGSPQLVARMFFFIKNSRKWVENFQRRYRILWNWVDSRNNVHIRWLEWCGFKLTGIDESYGVEGRPFYEFQRVRSREGAQELEEGS